MVPNGSNRSTAVNLRIHPWRPEVVRHGGPWRCLDDVEFATLEWVAWFNSCRLMEPLGYLPPAEYEAQFDQLRTAPALAGVLN